jgi:hypothetical protein
VSAASTAAINGTIPPFPMVAIEGSDTHAVILTAVYRGRNRLRHHIDSDVGRGTDFLELFARRKESPSMWGDNRRPEGGR